MDLNELVRKIAQEVLKELNAKESEKKCVRILGYRSKEIEARVLEHFGKDTDLVFLNENTDSAVPFLNILPKLSCAGMSELAAGRVSDAVDCEVLKLLLTGEKIEVLDFEYKTYQSTAPEALYNLYKDYEKKLQQYGLKQFTGEQPEPVRPGKSLVTEKDVIEAGEKGIGSLLIAQNSKITPLAAETAKKLNVKFEKR